MRQERPCPRQPDIAEQGIVLNADNLADYCDFPPGWFGVMAASAMSRKCVNDK